MKKADGHRIKAFLFDDLFFSTDYIIFISPMTAHAKPFISTEDNFANHPSSCYDKA